MTSNEILKADILDILFDNRNKQYGAYTLRRNYNRRLILALTISLSIIFLFILLLQNNNFSKGILQKKKDYVTVIQVVPPDIKKPETVVQQKAKPIQQVRQQQFTKFIIKPDDIVKKPVADQTTLMNSLISKITLDGREPKLGELPVVRDPAMNSGGGNSQKQTKFIPEEREPEFPGGQAAWLNFLRNNLIAPSELEIDEKKTVMVRFMVDVDGSVNGFEVIQSGGRSFDNEVVRVLKKMPKWKPAIQNGEPVARAYMQPVTFIGVEQ